ncbi:MAG: hypothetical protein WCC59_12765, partial [Terriglobales bacterium]
LLFIIVGLILCFTILFFMPGLGAIAVGALLCIAGRNEQLGPIAKGAQSVLGVIIGMVLMGGVFMWYAAATYSQRHKADTAPIVQPAPHTTKPAKKHSTAAGSPSR